MKNRYFSSKMPYWDAINANGHIGSRIATKIDMAPPQTLDTPHDMKLIG
jgi:hypothetical protein